MKATIRTMTRGAGRSPRERSALVRLAGDHGLRCVLYHDVAEATTAFTDGLGVTISPSDLSDHLEWMRAEYEFVSIDWVRSGQTETASGRPPLLVTFDDAYTGVLSHAAPACEAVGAPSVFFVNGSLVDNQTLALDNLVTWVVNSIGMAPVESAAGRGFGSLSEFFDPYLASIDLGERHRIFDELATLLPAAPGAMASEASLYVTSDDLRRAADHDMAIGNHTWSHVHCRHLDREYAASEIVRNRDHLQRLIGSAPTSFSYPYGSHVDAAGLAGSAVADSGHDVAFLVESLANRRSEDPMRLYRCSVALTSTEDLFTDLEVLPLLRRMRSRRTG